MDVASESLFLHREADEADAYEEDSGRLRHSHHARSVAPCLVHVGWEDRVGDWVAVVIHGIQRIPGPGPAGMFPINRSVNLGRIEPGAVQVRGPQIRLEQVREGQIRTVQFRKIQVRIGQDRAGQVRPDQVREVQIRAGEV